MKNNDQIELVEIASVLVDAMLERLGPEAARMTVRALAHMALGMGGATARLGREALAAGIPGGVRIHELQ